MYAAAGGASLAGRKARQHGRQPAPSSPHATSPVHPAPTGVRAYSCQHWEARLLAPPRPHSAHPSPPRSPCDVVECAAGRQAWQEAAALSVGEGGAAGGAARRCSVLGDHPGARRDKSGKWIRNNRVRDASYGSSSESEGEAENATSEPWGVARLLYAGLGTLSLGLVVYFVGTGDKGFKTPALRLVGPSLIVAGLACCLIRIAFCVFAKPCCRRRTNYKENRRLGGYGEGEELPLARGPRTGPAQCSPARRLDASSCDVSSLSSGEEDERMRRYRTTPAQLQQGAVQQITVQQKPESNRVPPPLSPAAASAMSQALRDAVSASLAIPSSTSFAIQASTSNALPSTKSNAMSASTSNAMPTSTSLATTASKSVTTSASKSIKRSAAPKSVTIPPSTSIAIPNSALQTPVSPVAPTSALYGGSRRPPPRNVSFAGQPDGELVLSPSQLRS